MRGGCTAGSAAVPLPVTQRPCASACPAHAHCVLPQLLYDRRCAVTRSPPIKPKLYGRTAALASLADRLHGGERLIVLRGPPGVGKSTLLRALSHHLSHEDTPVHLIALDAVTSASSVVATIANALGLTLRTDDPSIATDEIARALEAHNTILLFDGIETARHPVCALIRDLLDANASLSVVVASWRPLEIFGEYDFPVQPLSAVDAGHLLRARIERHGPQLALSEPHLEALLAQAQGLPLVLEILAGRVATFGPEFTLAALSEKGMVSDVLDRSLTVAWEQLSPREKRALTALSVFRSTFSAQSASEVIANESPADSLTLLMEASLVERIEQQEGILFRLYDSVRDFVLRQRDTIAERELARSRHAALFAQPTPRLDDPAAWKRLKSEREDRIAAWRYAYENKLPTVAQHAVTLDLLLVTQGLAPMHRRILEQSLDFHGTRLNQASREDQATLVDLHIALGRFHAIRGRHTEALRSYRAGFSLAQLLNDKPRTGWLAANLCFALRPLGALSEARAYGEQSLTLAAETHSSVLLAGAEQMLGLVHLAQGEYPLAIASFQRAIAAAQLTGGPRMAGIAYGNLLKACTEAEHWAQANEALLAAQASFELCDDRYHLNRMAVYHGILLVKTGRFADAESTLKRALETCIALGDFIGELDAREAMVRTANALGDRSLALRRLAILEAAAQLTDDVSWHAKLGTLRQALADAEAKGAELYASKAISLSPDGRSLHVGDADVDLSRRGPLRRILLALVTARIDHPGRALSAQEIQAAGWPGEKLVADSGSARVYMAIKRLRELGLEAHLLTTDAGYSLDPSIGVSWR